MSANDPKRTLGSAQHALLLRPNLLDFEPTGVVLSREMVPCVGEISSSLFLVQQPLGRCRCAHNKPPRSHRLPGRDLARGVHARDRGAAKGLAPTRLRRGKKYCHPLSVCRGRLRSPFRSRGRTGHVEGRCPPDPQYARGPRARPGKPPRLFPLS